MNHELASHGGVDLVPVEQHAGSAVAFVLDHFLLLPIGAAIALVWANTEGESYFRFAHALQFLVNQIGMALFIGLVTQEVVEEMVPGGALHHWRKTMLPLVAAIGGAIGAVVAYRLYVRARYEFVLLMGWPATMAVDIAVAYFVAKAIFGQRRGPIAFLLLVAIASDALGMLSIAIAFPVAGAHPAGLLLMAAAIGIAVWLRSVRLRTIWPYLLTSGVLAWTACYLGGVHPALALVPIIPFLPHRPRGLDPFTEGPHALHTSARHFEHVFRYPVQVVIFFFGLVNGGLLLTGEMTGAWGVLIASFIGRPVGMLAATGLAVAAGLHLPEHLRWRELIVVSLAASVGFMFALFFATAVLPPSPLLGDLKYGALWSLAGVGAAFAAARLLRVGRFSPRHLGAAHEPHGTQAA